MPSPNPVNTAYDTEEAKKKIQAEIFRPGEGLNFPWQLINPVFLSPLQVKHIH